VDLEYRAVDREPTPHGLLELRHYRAPTGEEGYEITLDGAFLMATHGCHAERAMAGLAYERLGGRREGIAALVGGLGAGHTLRATLDLDGVERVVVCEIGARVVEWNRRWFADANGRAVDDPRVEIDIADVTHLLQAAPRSFDLVLLDVDNGPGWLASPSNARLYEATGLASVRAALRPGGVAAIWSPAPNSPFESEAAAAGIGFERVDTAELGRVEGEPGSTIYLLRSA